MFLGKKHLGRDKDFHNDFSVQPLHIEEREIISVYPPGLEFEWALVANMQRKFRASLSENFGQEYLLTTTDYINSESIVSYYERIPPFNTKKYVFFKLHD